MSPGVLLPAAVSAGSVQGLKRFWHIAFFVATAATGLAVPAAERTADPAALAHRVVVVANRNDPDSLRIAQHYAAARGVPEANVLAFAMPANETVSWPEFVANVWSPLLERLVEQGWIDAIPMNVVDDVGRRKYIVQSHRIAALVVCRGVPLRVNHEPASYREHAPYTKKAPFRTNAGAVDAELSLLAQPNYNINAFVENPLFQKAKPSALEEQQVVKVSRLDGPTADDALALVDRALAAERNGLAGRAYIDLSDYDPIGNEWLEAAGRQLEKLGFDTDIDRAPAIMPATARVDAPAFYFGWYTEHIGGAMALPGFRFPDGAIALHIHSYSAATLRSSTSGWTGPLIARGVTATFGNVFEPYLQLTERPDLLVEKLAAGANLVDATYYGLVALSWQEVLIGDPLYRPFAVPLEEQLQARGESLSPYAVIRAAKLSEAAGKRAQALARLRESLRREPTLPVALALSERLKASGDKAGAASALGVAVGIDHFSPNEWAIAAEAGRQLAVLGRAAQSIEVWSTLLRDAALPAALRLTWLPTAIGAADEGGRPGTAADWRRQLSELKPAK
jgi:uncharacterized protein (TIGR03790 family)